MSSPENSQECPQCKIIFETPPTLKMFTPKGERIHTCPQCNKGFKGKSETVDPGTSFSAGKMEGQKTWLCMKCFEKFSSQTEMDSHMQTHSAMSCPECQSTFSPSTTVKIYSSFGNKIYSCPSCDKIFSEPSKTKDTDAAFFADKIDGGKTWLCILKKFDDSSEMDAYVKAHSQPTLIAQSQPKLQKKAPFKRRPRTKTKQKQQFPCTDCSKVFRWKSQLDRHIPTHTKKSEPKLEIKAETYSSDTDNDGIIAGDDSPDVGDVTPSDEKPSINKMETDKTKTKSSVKRKKFKCPHCTRAFTWQLGLDRHIVTHTVEKPYSCNLCEEKFKKPSQLQRHVIHDHKFCEKCHTKFETVALLEEHLLTHKRKMIYTCPHCNKEFNRGFKFREHVTSHTGDKPHMCHQCGKKFRLYNNMRRHMRLHTGQKPYACPHCPKKFVQSGHLKLHLAYHTGEKNHVCELCGKAFVQAGNLKQHMYSHSSDGTPQCKQTREKNHPCPICGIKYRFAATLQRHMCVHTGEAPPIKAHKCPDCEKSFTQASGLYIHKKNVHEGKRVICPYCGKKFQKGTLKAHIRVHTGEKPYVCKDCGKGFALSGNLKRHMVTHTDERPHVCVQCGKRFNQISNLKAHMDTHILNKPHRCLKCKMRFAEEDQLQRHKCYPSRLKQHICQQCGKGFNKPSCLQKHNCTGSAPVPNIDSNIPAPNIEEEFLASFQHAQVNLMVPKDPMNLQFYSN